MKPASSDPPRKLIEVAFPLAEVGREAAREKSIRLGHPSTLHLWWSRKPLAAARSVLFAQLVDDPSSNPAAFPTPQSQAAERKRLLKICASLARWEASADERLLKEARELIAQSPDARDAVVLDAFCGGGSIPLEASRLGLPARAQDLNPVAAFITRALADLPGRFAVQGLAEDVRAVGEWVESWAHQRLASGYPQLQTATLQEATVVAWFHVRTVPCPHCGTSVPLASKWWLKRKPGVWVEPLPDGSFAIRREGEPTAPTVSRAGTSCQRCEGAISLTEIREAGKRGDLHHRPIACIAQTDEGRVFLPVDDALPTPTRTCAEPTGPFAEQLTGKCAVSVPLYGMGTIADLFPKRAWVAMQTFREAIEAAHEVCAERALARDLPEDPLPLHQGGRGRLAYAEALRSYLGCALSRCADFWSSLATWTPRGGFVAHTFTLQALPMTWDFAEANPFSARSGSWGSAIGYVSKVIERLPPHAARVRVTRTDSRHAPNTDERPIVCTDPPYFDNIEYAALSDYFFAWLQPTVGELHPDLFDVLRVPSEAELVPSPFRFETRQAARKHFTEGLRDTFSLWHDRHHPTVPAVIFYAFKRDLTGWATLLEALMAANWRITRAWPLRIERPARTVARGSDALASSMVLVCRPQEPAPDTFFEDAMRNIERSLPQLLDDLEDTGITPVDLPQAIIGICFETLGQPGALGRKTGEQVSIDDALARCHDALCLAAKARVEPEALELSAQLLEHFEDDETALPKDPNRLRQAKRAATFFYLQAQPGTPEARRANRLAIALAASAPPQST